ncbi:hypothetical protein HK405_004685 [Cladochytrium tenue]|nr:hypothetical protein HK405_004685 [Cladochytrium tenue]
MLGAGGAASVEVTLPAADAAAADAAGAAAAGAAGPAAADCLEDPQPPRDTFFWLGEINKASLVVNTDEGLLDAALAPAIARGLDAVLRAGNAPGGARPHSVITFEPLLIRTAGVEATLLHAGRSSQDMLATATAAATRDGLLRVAVQLRRTTTAILDVAAANIATVVPNYTNGVAAQPNSLAHELLGHVAGLARDAERIRQAYVRLNRSPMGSTVLNGSNWPLNRDRMAALLGFAAVADNAYDAGQIAGAEIPVEVGAIGTSVALHCGAYIQSLMTQYADPRPWILLRPGDGTTYVSSAMPQKLNPGLLVNVRAAASRLVTLGVGRAIAAHNLPPGMVDPRTGAAEIVDACVELLEGWERVMRALVIDPQRALDALNADWTASQELADSLMRRFGLPFRVGHHFASEVVHFARAKALRPTEFPYSEACAIYARIVGGSSDGARTEAGSTATGAQLPLSEEEFRAALDPVAIVRNRATRGGPQPAEVERMLAEARSMLERDGEWMESRRRAIDEALLSLGEQFAKYLVPEES